MSLAWQKLPFMENWAGLFSRRQAIDVGHQFASVARNIDFFGSAIGKRLGSQLVNGWGTVVAADWLNAPNATGTVTDAAGFQPGDTLMWRNPDESFGTGTIAAVNYGTNTVTLSAPAGAVPLAGGTIWTVRPAGMTRLDGLFHAMFRDGSEFLLAASLTDGVAPQAEQVWNVWDNAVNAGASYVPAVLPDHTQDQVTVVAADWGSTTTGRLITTETLVAADGTTNIGLTTPPTFPNDLTPSIIQILHAGVVIYEGTLAHIAVPNTITLTAPAAIPPVADDPVRFFPHRTAGDTRFAQGANVTHVTSAAGANAVAGSVAATPSVGGVPTQPVTQRTPPIKFGVQPTIAIQRHGIKAPTTPPGVVIAGPGVVNVTGVTYRAKYRNSTTEQESEPGPPSLALNTADFSVEPHVTVVGSPDPQVDKIRLYRTANLTFAPWYFVGEVDNPPDGGLGGGTAVFVDQVADPPDGPVMREFLDFTVPDTVSQLVYWPQAFRLVGIDAGNEVVVVSDGPDPTIDPVTNSRGRLKLESFPPDNVLFVNRDDGDHLVGLAAFYDAVLIFKRHSVWRLIGTPPDIVVQPVLFRDDLSAVGAFSPKAIAVDQDQMVFAGDDGAYGVSREEGLAAGFTSERTSRQIDDEWAPRIIAEHADRAHIVFTRQRRQLRLFVPVDGNPSGEPNETFVYQFDGTVDGQPHGWAEWTPPAVFTSPDPFFPLPNLDTSASAVVRQGQTFPVAYTGTTKGLVLKMDQPLGNDAGAKFLVEYQTVWFAPPGPGSNTRGRALDTLWVVDEESFAGTGVTPSLSLAADFALPAATIFVHIPPGALAQNLRGVVFLLGQFHRLGFVELDIQSRYRLLGFTYLFQAQAPTVADRSGFVQTLA